MMHTEERINRLLAIENLDLSDEVILSLRSLYEKLLKSKGNYNAESLGSIFEFWLRNLRVTLSCDIKVPVNCLNLFSYLSRSESINFKGDIEHKIKPLPSFVKSISLWILTRLPLPYGVFPGGHLGKLGWLLELITYYKIRFSNNKYDIEFRDEFLKKSENYVSVYLYNIFFYALPNVFLQHSRSCFLFPKKVYGSSTTMFNDAYLNILFFTKKIDYIVIVHGGNSGELRINRVDGFDNDLGKYVLSWGLGKRNIVQNRFPVMHTKPVKIKNAAIVGVIPPTRIINDFFPESHVYQIEANKFLPKIRELFLPIFPLKYLKHPRYSTNIENEFCATTSIEKLLQKGDYNTILVFDRPGHTLLYRAIYQNLPFVIISDRNWHILLSHKYVQFLNKLEELGLLFYRDQELELIYWLKELAAGKYYSENYFISARLFLEDGKNVNLKS